MKTLFKRENSKTTLLSLIYLILGVLFCVMPVKMFNFVELTLCFILLAAGIVCIAIYSLLSVEDKPLKLLLYGIVGVVLGLCMMLFPKFFGVLLSIIVGYSGISMIISGVKLKKQKDNTWITDFVIGVVVTALSITTIILSLIGSSIGKNILSIFFAIILLINGIYNLVQLIMIIKKEKENKKKQLIENVLDGVDVTEIATETSVNSEEKVVEDNKNEAKNEKDIDTNNLN